MQFHMLMLASCPLLSFCNTWSLMLSDVAYRWHAFLTEAKGSGACTCKAILLELLIGTYDVPVWNCESLCSTAIEKRPTLWLLHSSIAFYCGVEASNHDCTICHGIPSTPPTNTWGLFLTAISTQKVLIIVFVVPCACGNSKNAQSVMELLSAGPSYKYLGPDLYSNLDAESSNYCCRYSLCLQKHQKGNLLYELKYESIVLGPLQKLSIASTPAADILIYWNL